MSAKPYTDEELAEFGKCAGYLWDEARLLATLDARDAEIAALRLLYREAVRALQDVEWGPSPASPRSDCPWCLNEMRQGHENDCAITAVLSTPEAQAALKDGQP